MSDEETDDKTPEFHLEHGLPVFNDRLNEVERKSAESDSRDLGYKKDQLELNRRMVDANNRLVYATLALFLMSVVGNMVAGYQSCVSRRVAKSSEDAVAQSKKNNTDAITAQQQIAQTSLSASQHNADMSIHAVMEQMHLDQRAWITTKVTADKPEINHEWSVQVHFTNTGKTPAKEFRDACAFEYSASEKALLTHPTFGTSGMITPAGDGYCFRQYGILKQADMDALSSKNARLYVHGAAIYKDVFGDHHWVTFCKYLIGDGTQWNTCGRGEDTGDGKAPPNP